MDRNALYETEEPLEETALGEVDTEPERIATNRAIRLSCTLAAGLGLFGLFLCWAERESRAIRLYAVRSAALMILVAAAGAGLYLVCVLLGGIPYFGYAVQLVCWLGFIALCVAVAIVRVRMMYAAWQGWRFRLPAGDVWLTARFDR